MPTFGVVATILVSVASASAQLAVTNNIAQDEAIKVALQLKLGMWEEDATKLLANYSLTNSMGIGAAGGWGRFYTLKEGTSLVLDYSPRKVAMDGRWGGNGILEKVYIQSNLVNIPVAVTNKVSRKPK